MSRSASRTSNALGHHEQRVWPADPSAYGGRKTRRGGAYRVFIPHPIADRNFSFDADAVAAISHAVRGLAALSGRPQAASIAGLASALLRSESVASSRIEGVAISHKRLARAEYRRGSKRGDPKAAEVLGNVKAMRQALEIGASAKAFSVADIEEVHRTLLRFTEDEAIAGVVRGEQNWIGGNDYNPIGADYVPPPSKHVPHLLQDLCLFIARDDLAPVAQAAIAHAQFENIHPFADGNGRTGRALIYAVLRRRGEIGDFIPPISLVLGAQPKAYVGGLGAYSVGKVDLWCSRFADATAQAANMAEELADGVADLQAQWLERLGNPRSDATVRQLVAALPGQPVIDVAAGQEIAGKSHVAVGQALQQMEHSGVLQRLNEKRWGRLWECGELLDLLSSFEKRMSTP